MIRVLTKDNLDTASEPQDLLKETYKFNKALFTAQPCDEHVRNEFLNFTIPKLSDNVRMSCEGLNTEELSKAVKAMECNKSPGCDGLTTNFWPILGESLTCVYNYAFENGFLLYHRDVESLVYCLRKEIACF